MQSPFERLLGRLDPDAEAELRALIGGAMRTQVVSVAAKLGIADLLASGPRSAEELAASARADAGALRRLLRYAVSIGVFMQDPDGRFRLNATGEYLQAAHPRSLRAGAIRAGEGFWQTLSKMGEAVTRGVSPVASDASFFDAMRTEGRAGAFANRMLSTAPGLGAAIAGAFDFGAVSRVVDVGGGHGAVLQELLARHAHLEGVLFDTPEMIDAVRALRRHEVPQRCAFEGGDFFVSVPPADVYVLSWILHDWNDEDAVRILKNCAIAAPGATLLIAEAVMPEVAERMEQRDGLAADPFTLDIQMMLLTGGRERTEAEFRDVLARGGYSLKTTTLLPTTRGASLMTATPERADQE